MTDDEFYEWYRKEYPQPERLKRPTGPEMDRFAAILCDRMKRHFGAVIDDLNPPPRPQSVLDMMLE